MTRFVPSLLQRGSRSSVQSDDSAISAYSLQFSKKNSAATAPSSRSPLAKDTTSQNVKLAATAGPASYPQPATGHQAQQLSHNHALSHTRNASNQISSQQATSTTSQPVQQLQQPIARSATVAGQPKDHEQRADGLRKVYAQVQSILADQQQHPLFRRLELNEAGALKVEMNPDCIQCPCCRRYFFNAPARQQHHHDFPGNCDKCRLCFRLDDIVDHASTFQHSRCFVPGCTSNFRIERIYTNNEIYDHVLAEHTPRRRR